MCFRWELKDPNLSGNSELPVLQVANNVPNLDPSLLGWEPAHVLDLFQALKAGRVQAKAFAYALAGLPSTSSEAEPVDNTPKSQRHSRDPRAPDKLRDRLVQTIGMFPSSLHYPVITSLAFKSS